MTTRPSTRVARAKTSDLDLRPTTTSPGALRALEAAGLGAAIVEVDAGGCIVDLSPSAAVLLNIGSFEAIGRHLGEVAAFVGNGPKSRAPTAEDLVRSVLRTGVARSPEVFRILRSDGRTRWVELGAALLAEREGEARGAACTLTDVTSLVRTRDALAGERKAVARASERFRALMDGMADAMLVHSEGRGGFANRALLDLVGASSVQDIVGKDVGVLLPGHVPGGGSALRQERWTLGSRGPVLVELTERTIDIEGAPATMVLARDVTERVATQAKLMHSDRLATLGTLVAGLVHEINNPLGAVLANVQFARETVEREVSRGRSGEMLDALGDAEQGIRLVAGIAKDLKSFGRDDGGTLARVDLRGIVRAALTLTKANVHARADLTVSLPEDAVPVVANESRLAQVFINLLLNATQALDGTPRNDSRVRVTVKREGGRAIVEVSDTGHGMSAETLARLFEPFFTTKARDVGTGLGLWMCWTIVHAHGGTMTVESAVGTGTTFRVWLPAAASE